MPSEQLSQKTITIPWTDGLKLGDGFRQFERALASRSAVQPFEVKNESMGKEVILNSMTVVDEQSMRRQINTNLKVEAPVYGVPIRVESGFLNSAEYSDTTMTTFIEMTIKEKACMYQTLPSLTQEASEILSKDPNEFRKHFGDYFVAGYIAQSSLVATCVFTAKSSQALNEFKSQLGANIQPASVEATGQMSRTAQSLGISTRISTHVVGLSMNPEQKGLNIKEIESTLEDFKRNHTPREHTAILLSFSALNLKATPFSSTDSIFDGLQDAFKDIFKLLDIVRHARIRKARSEMEDKVLAHAERLQKIMCQGDMAPKFEAWKRTYEELIKEYKVWEQRQNVLDSSRRDLTQRLWPGQGSNTSGSDWIAAGTQAEWMRGTCWFEAGSPLYPELVSEHVSYSPSWKVGENNSPDMTINGGDKIIIGYKVNSHWQDGTNGRWRAIYISPERVTVRFRSDPVRGCNWTLTAYMVPKNIYDGA